jgi:Rha family phage regulatory protein
MHDLNVFEENGQLWTDSREVALMVDKDHSKLLRDIRGYCEYLTEANFGLSEYFIESSYQDSTGRILPRYLCTKIGCDMIANKMIGKKGVIFTARYIEAFEKMRDFIEKGIQYSNQVSFKEQVECIGVIAEILRVNDASKLMMIGQLYKSYDLPTEFLPNYEFNGNRELRSATDLLKRYDLGMSAKNFNLLLLEYGYLEERSRRSTATPNKEKNYKALTEKGLKYGENAVSPQNQREVQPMYYDDSFKELFDMVVDQIVA